MKQNIKGLSGSLKRLLRQYAESIAFAVIVAIFIRAFVMTAYRVPTHAMAPSLVSGDFIFAFKLPYMLSGISEKLGAVRRGDVIIYKCPDNKAYYCIKRVIGMPGESVAIEGGQVLLNNTPVSTEAGDEAAKELAGGQFLQSQIEKYENLTVNILVSEEEAPDFGPVDVPAGSFFVLGDNRALSDDSRTYGVIPAKDIIGRASLVWLSLDWEEPQYGGILPKFRTNRLLQVVR